MKEQVLEIAASSTIIVMDVKNLSFLVFAIAAAGFLNVTSHLTSDSRNANSVIPTGDGTIVHADIHEVATFVWSFKFTEEYEYMEVIKSAAKGTPLKRIAYKLRGSDWALYKPFESRVHIVYGSATDLKFNLLDTKENDGGTYQLVITLKSGSQLTHTQQLVVKIVGPCAEGVCRNNGTCHSPSKGAYTCSCIEGFAGKNCTINYIPLGCHDEDIKDRALPTYLVSFRSSIDWHNMDKTVKACSEYASQHGYEVFGVQFFGECWSGRHADTSYNRHGPSKYCWQGVGKAATNFVYENRIVKV